MEHETMKQRIKEKYDSLSSQEKKVAKYIIDNYQQSILLSSSGLAQLSGVSNTAVIRFAKALGFHGFLEYKREIRKEYVPVQRVYASLPLMDRDNDYVHSYFHNLNLDIQAFFQHLPLDIFTKMAETIIHSRRVYLMGCGSDEVVVHFLKNYLNVMGISCTAVTEEGLALREKMFLLSPEDCVFVVAFPTMTESERWVSRYAHRKQATLLTLTDSEITAKQLGADLFAVINERADTFFNSYVLPMAFCNGLLLRIFELNQDRATQAMKEYQALFE